MPHARHALHREPCMAGDRQRTHGRRSSRASGIVYAPSADPVQRVIAGQRAMHSVVRFIPLTTPSICCQGGFQPLPVRPRLPAESRGEWPVVDCTFCTHIYTHTRVQSALAVVVAARTSTTRRAASGHRKSPDIAKSRREARQTGGDDSKKMSQNRPASPFGRSSQNSVPSGRSSPTSRRQPSAKPTRRAHPCPSRGTSRRLSVEAEEAAAQEHSNRVFAANRLDDGAPGGAAGTKPAPAPSDASRRQCLRLLCACYAVLPVGRSGDRKAGSGECRADRERQITPESGDLWCLWV